MSEEPIISLRNVSKTYRAYDHPLHRLITRISGGRAGHYKEFHALNDVSFDIHKGETVGIIGRNGSGKSTLLQIICGIRQPTSGSVKVKGRISALLELGSGFQPEFTGRENVFLQGAIIGLTREEMETRFDDIAAFADIGEYIDQPVKTYSSGMFVRLAFSVAISTDPDILVVDEALAVGDIGFQQKCLERISQMRDSGITIFMVAHDIMLMRNFGDTLIYLEHGRIKKVGDPEMVGEIYLRDTIQAPQMNSISDAKIEFLANRASPNIIRKVWVSIKDNAAFIHVNAKLAREITNPEIVIQLRDPRGYIIYGSHARGSDVQLSKPTNSDIEAEATLELNFTFLAGNYAISVSLNKLDAYGTPIVLDKQVGIAALQVPLLPNAGFHGCVNLGGKWLQANAINPDKGNVA